MVLFILRFFVSMLNLFYYDFGVRLIKPDPNIYYRTFILCALELLFQLFFAEGDADGAAVGAVFQVLSGHDLLC